MLDVIADFWKPVKKATQQEPLRPELLEIGSSLGFGFVPQALLSGRRLTVADINTYLFGKEALTSFVLSQEKDPSVSMIVAESEGEYYLAISRRISLNDRMRLFEEKELEAIMQKTDNTRMSTQEQISEYKGWIVSSYKREIQGLKGVIYKGDFRKGIVPDEKHGSTFEYTLLVSDSNEHAIEIERYNDGRIEIYATVYRRMSDIGEINHPNLESKPLRPEVKLGSDETTEAPSKPSPALSSLSLTDLEKTDVTKPTNASGSAASSDNKDAINGVAKMEDTKASTKIAEPIKAEENLEDVVQEVAKEIAVELEADDKAALKTEPTEEKSPVIAAPETKTQPYELPELEEAPKEDKPASESTQETQTPITTNVPQSTAYSQTTTPNQTRTHMSNAEAVKPKLYIQPTNPDATDNTTAPTADGQSIECDLRVANKIIDEAIRNEMRLTDIVRRIVELPVAYPESVQIPMSLTDEDYALLAIRYGISSSDRNAIRARILEDLNSFSGKKD